MMQFIVALAAALASPSEPRLSSPVREAIIEMAASGWLAGACERYLPKGEIEAFLTTARNPDGKPGESEFDRFVGGLTLRSYAEGRIDPARLRLGPENCQRLIDKQRDILDRVTAALP